MEFQLEKVDKKKNYYDFIKDPSKRATWDWITNCS